MGIEAPVFVSQQQFQVAGIDAGSGIDGQTPAAVCHGIGAQQLAVAVDDRGGDFPRLRQRERAERDDPCREGAGHGEDCKGYGGSDANNAPFANTVMAGFHPAIHVFRRGSSRRGCPGQARA